VHSGGGLFADQVQTPIEQIEYEIRWCRVDKVWIRLWERRKERRVAE